MVGARSRKSCPIEAVEVWNRGEGALSDRLNGFTLTLLDGDRKPVYQKKDNRAPESLVRFDITDNRVQYAGEPERKEIPAGHRDPEFAFMKGDTIACIGNGLADRMQHDGWVETAAPEPVRPEQRSRFRNLAFTGDTVTKLPRSKGFTPPERLPRTTARRT